MSRAGRRGGKREWVLMGTGFLFWDSETVLRWNDHSYTTVNKLKSTKLYTLNRSTFLYVCFTSVKLFKVYKEAISHIECCPDMSNKGYKKPIGFSNIEVIGEFDGFNLSGVVDNKSQIGINWEMVWLWKGKILSALGYPVNGKSLKVLEWIVNT